MQHLNWLANQGWLDRHGYNQGYIYNITESGYRRCRDIPGIDIPMLPYKYDPPSGNHAEHELEITQIAVAIMECIRTEPSVTFLEDGRFMLDRYEWLDPETGEVVRPFADRKPDYWYMFRDSKGWMIRFIEVFEGERSAKRYLEKLKQYEEWAARDDIARFLKSLYAKHGATQPQPEYQLHCIFSSDDWKYTESWKERQTQQQAFLVTPQTQARLWTTTRAAILNAEGEGLTISNARWSCGRHFVEHRSKWEDAKPMQRTRVVDMLMQNVEPTPLFA